MVIQQSIPETITVSRNIATPSSSIFSQQLDNTTFTQLRGFDWNDNVIQESTQKKQIRPKTAIIKNYSEEDEKKLIDEWRKEFGRMKKRSEKKLEQQLLSRSKSNSSLSRSPSLSSLLSPSHSTTALHSVYDTDSTPRTAWKQLVYNSTSKPKSVITNDAFKTISILQKIHDNKLSVCKSQPQLKQLPPRRRRN